MLHHAQEEEEGKEGDEGGLRIAWQYRRYLKTGGPVGGPPAVGQLASSRGGGSTASGASSSSSSGSSRGAAGGSSSSGGGSGSAPRRSVGLRDWCHQFDLLKGLGEEGLQQCRAELADCSSGSEGGGAAGAAGGSTQRLVSVAAAFVRSLAPPEEQQQGQERQQEPAPAAVGARAPPAPAQPRGPWHVGRIAVLSLGSLGWQLGEPEQQPAAGGSISGDGGAGTALLRALLQLKALVREARCTAVASVPAALLSPSDAARLHHLADCVVSLESVADDSDIVR